MTTSKVLAKKLEQYAARAHTGMIVELGTYHGTGTIALARGTAKGFNLPVVTIDDYQPKRGWINEPYGPEDKEVFHKNMKDAGLQFRTQQWMQSFDSAVKGWKADISLLYWDPGMKNRCAHDFENWSKFIVTDGIYIIKDTAHNDLGSASVIEDALVSGLWKFIDSHRGVVFLRRTRK
jgi:hypothetical protein